MKNIFKNIVAITGILSIISCGNDAGQQQQAQGPTPFPVLEVPVRTLTGYTSYPTNLEGVVNSAVRAKVSGYITDVLVDEGEKVQKGQLLFKLETESLSQEAGAARANVNAAQVEVNKLEPLVEKNIISGVQLETAKAQLAQAQANYQSIAANIGYANIKSPVDGYVGAIPYREGALVSPGDPMPLTTVSQIDEIYAFFSMNESDYLSFIQNTEGANLSEKIDNIPPVELQLVNGTIYDHKGEIETVTGQVDPSTGTVSFRAVFPNPNEILASGNSGQIRIPKTYEDVPVVPQASSFEQQGKVYVYHVQGDSLAVSRVVEVRDRVQSLIIVASGIEVGDKIVAEGVGQLRNNTPIQPQPVPFDSIANTLQPVFK
ncbi:efflux RND transporter periplasmic adaptor subunit [Autumnicola edwardsiae]|jgi:membrane fusion protein (multidrug efflux system)|uniref:Efflux RND transporter periplasmic adaptor subunit n=1 Tax=Autumnicola edwardsiae TaxID=3075594 RepID=A0ABU3CT10_9FLAO|nr:efflux RND transporter periplasmic adaptor subunit [Zunongwangia sp. F297]MDT0649441.1 efflux RND transporter periplasmic adaptor subunit [Zunongwangia sp. F297]